MKRFEWARLPEPARTAFEAEFGRVRRAVTTPAGLTVGIASRVETERTTVFVKAVPMRSPALPGYERERAVGTALPVTVPAPRLLWVSEGGWLTLVFEHVAGEHVDFTTDAKAVMSALISMREPLRLSPVPGIPPIDEKLGVFLETAREFIAATPNGVNDAKAYESVISETDLADFAGDSLIHADLTASNMIHDGERVHFVDWAMASRGAAWTDAALLIPNLIGAGYAPQDAERWACGHPDWRGAPPRALDALAAMRLLFLREKIHTGPDWLATDRRASLWTHEAWARYRLRQG